MVITARYPSTCPCCGNALVPGEQVNWAPGEKASHLACTPRPAPAPMPPAPTGPILPQKGIYRVSLTGAEARYGEDHVNVQLVPDARYGTVKVKEWGGESIGRLGKDGRLRFWPGIDPYTPRVRLLAHAVEVVLGSADPTAYARAYAVAAVACMRCGADLVDDESRARLLGPECAKHWRS